MPKVPQGFTVAQLSSDFKNPREIRTAPNGDIFVAESEPGRLKVVRMGSGAPQIAVFAEGLNMPFGIAFYPPGPNPQFVYVGNTDSVWRYPYKNGDLSASGPKQVLVTDIPGGGHLRGGGHWTRDLAFSADGSRMFVSVGSHSNHDDPDEHKEEFHRANILEYTPDGKFVKVYAYGIRNPVGITVHPTTGQIWASVNERDTLGDNLVPDYITHVQENGFYGWPYFYIGPNQDPSLMEDILNCDRRSSFQTFCCSRTTRRSKCFSMEAPNSRRNIGVMHSLPNTALGTVRIERATR